MSPVSNQRFSPPAIHSSCFFKTRPIVSTKFNARSSYFCYTLLLYRVTILALDTFYFVYITVSRSASIRVSIVHVVLRLRWGFSSLRTLPTRLHTNRSGNQGRTNDNNLTDRMFSHEARSVSSKTILTLYCLGNVFRPGCDLCYHQD